MIPPKQTERGNAIMKSDKATGTKIVISGALAAIALWLIVLIIGHPIKPFTESSVSLTYALGISVPAIILSVLAIARTARRKEEI